MGETLAQTICGNRTEYKPGHWFNSAKFLDIEYQTYGWVFAKRKTEDEATFPLETCKRKICITVAYHKDTNVFLGINTFGIRMRHEIFDKWLTEKRDIDYVMNYLKDANFDPEFYKAYETDILSTIQYRIWNTNLTTEKRVGNAFLQSLIKSFSNFIKSQKYHERQLNI